MLFTEDDTVPSKHELGRAGFHSVILTGTAPHAQCVPSDVPQDKEFRLVDMR